MQVYALGTGYTLYVLVNVRGDIDTMALIYNNWNMRECTQINNQNHISSSKGCKNI